MTTGNSSRGSSADCLILGGGMAGISLAAELAGLGADVIILEQDDMPGRHATGRSAAMHIEAYGNETVRALTMASREFLECPPEGFTDVPLLTPRDCLLVGSGADQQIFDREVARSADWEVLDCAEALERVPILSRDWLALAAVLRTSAEIEVASLLQGYLRSARRNGARLHCATRHAEPVRRDGRWQIDTAVGRFESRVLVNAAGAWAGEVAAAAGATPLPLTPLRRTAVTIDTPCGLDPHGWPMVMSARESFYFKPEAGRLLLSPANEDPDVPGDCAPDDLDVAIAIDRFIRATGCSVRSVVSRWAGLRTFAADRTPVVGYDPLIEDFFWFAGQGGYGIQLAPALARLGAQLVVRSLNAPQGSELEHLIGSIDPDRPSLRPSVLRPDALRYGAPAAR